MIKLLSDAGLKCPIANQYEVLTVQSAPEDNAAIIKVLSVIMYNNLLNDLVLLNYYDGMPISFGASVERINNGIVAMSVHSFQAVSMMLQNITFIKSDLLPHWVMASVLKIDRENNLAYLALFSYIQNRSDRRNFVRMRLPEMVEASFHNKKQEVPGSVREISFGGVALLAPQEKVLKEKEKGIISLLLPNARLDIPGVFLQYQEQDALKRHIFQMKMNATSERIFSQFIFEQQSKIMEELEHLPGENGGLHR
jgi:c-di-GMP-binding flagellar brake protein YcgR